MGNKATSLLLIFSTALLLPMTNGQTPITPIPRIENKELANKLRVTLKVWLNDIEPMPLGYAIETSKLLRLVVENLTAGDYMMQINWRVSMSNNIVKVNVKTKKHIDDSFTAINSSATENLRDRILGATMEKVGRPDIKLYFLPHDAANSINGTTNWTTSAEDRAKNTAEEQGADIVIVVDTYQGSKTKALIYAQHDDNPFARMEPGAGKLAILMNVKEKIRKLLLTCRCTMVGDGICYWNDAPAEHVGDVMNWLTLCRNVTCVNEWVCGKRYPKTKIHRKYCSTNNILAPCQKKLCQERCDNAPHLVRSPCNATCSKPIGVQRVELKKQPRYECCEESWLKRCDVQEGSCEAKRRFLAAGAALVVIALLLVPAMVAGVVIVLRRQWIAPPLVDPASKASKKTVKKYTKLHVAKSSNPLK